jgi:amino acid adenylation domain-containing protein
MLSDAQRAALIAQLRRDRAANPAGRIARRPPDMVNLPASFGQEQLWFLDRLAPGRSIYNLPCAVRMRGQLDVSALSRAVDGLIARHEALRTRLVAGRDSHPVQVIDRPPDDVTEVLDFGSSDDSDAAWRRLRQLADDDLHRPFNLADGPLLRVHLVRLAADEHVLLITAHHAVFDGWSVGVLLADLAALYRAEVADVPSGLAELPVQFADYAIWERGRLEGGAAAELEQYWREVMAGFENLRLPADRTRPSVSTFDGAMECRSLPADLLDGLRELSRREGATLFVTLLAGLQALLHRYTGQTDIVVGTTSANRSRAALAPLIGFLVNTLPVRADLSGDPAFAELLGRVRQATVGAYAHQDLPFGMLVETLQVHRDASRAPVVQLMFNLVETLKEAVPAAGVMFELVDRLAEADTAKFDISLFADVAERGLELVAVYASSLFDAATVQRLLGNLEVLLRGAVANPSARLSQLPVLTEEELHREVAEWNDTAAQFPVVCIHQGFQAQVARTPDGIAAQLGDECLSYAQLNRAANQVARRLRQAGVGPETLVGVCMRTGLRRLAALLGILKAGGGYVPLDPALPAERISFMLADADLAVVLVDDSTWAGLPPTSADVVSLDAEWPAISELADTDLADADLAGHGAAPSNVAYVIYTSGSTGQPKGVVVEHRQAVNFLHGMIARWNLGTCDAVLQFASLSFDVSVMDIFVPLLAGGRVVLVPPEVRHSARRLAALIRTSGVTFACLTPAVLSLLAEQDLTGLRALVSGGEELSSELVRAWLRPGLNFYNTYGPTEAAVVTTFILLDACPQLPPPIGRPLPNYQAYVLDAQLSPVPVGAVGELHVGGAGVARGYLNRPELTRQRFITDPFSPQPGARLYKTGDLVRRRADGSIVFTGRIDTQVKIRGFRVELGEIETVLAAHPAVAQAVATVITDQAGEKQLAAYLRAEPGTEPDPGDLRAHLARTLPAYMVPAHLVTVADFPLNTSGKVDRSALPAPDPVPTGTGFAAPATFTESALVDIYTAVLSRDQVGATDSFFDVGGSSLQVMRLVDQISSRVGVDVGISTIFLHPTPRQLAASIDAIRSGGAGLAGSGPLIELSAGAGELPLFLIHAVGGTAFAYAQLASDLAGTFRVYGMEAPGLTDADANAGSLAGLVQDYTRRIRQVQPDGPYRLAGWSMGGVIAFEIARRLEQAGAEVCLLVLLDAPFALPDTDVPAESQLAGRFLADAAHSAGWDLADAPDPAAATSADQLAWLAERLGAGPGDAASQLDRGAVAARLRRQFDVFHAHLRMLAGYQATAPRVTAPTLIVSADNSVNAPDRSRWPLVLGGSVRTHRVDGDHYTFLRQPVVTGVGTSILNWHAATVKPVDLVI